MDYSESLSEAGRQLVQAYKTALVHYRSQDWNGAEAAFRECLTVVPADRPSQVMLDRIAAFREALNKSNL